MNKGLEALTAMGYPGRFIILGRDKANKHDVVVYGITGRSPSSQARRIDLQTDYVDGVEYRKLMVQPTDEAVVNQGQRELLIYPAIMMPKECKGVGIAVSNGAQTISIRDVLMDNHQSRFYQPPMQILASAMANWSFEPDEPNYTPRISGVICKGASLSIKRRGSDGQQTGNAYLVPLLPGNGKLISTYATPTAAPLPSFRGDPLDVGIEFTTAPELADAVYECLAPKDPAKDYRVAVVALFHDASTNHGECGIVNRSDRRRSP